MCIAWGIGNKTNSNRIIKLQKRDARTVLKKLVMIFKLLNNQTHTYVHELLGLQSRKVL